MNTMTSADVAVIAPSPMLTVTVEPEGEIHLHAGGQGLWVARQAVRLDRKVTLCGAFGGEIGIVLRQLIVTESVKIVEVIANTSNGAYIHDRRSGARHVVAQAPAAKLSRHAVDDLYGAAFSTGIEAAVIVLTGTDPAGLVPAAFYRRIARDLTSNGRTVIGDLTGAELDAALSGGLTLLKVSAADLVTEGRAADDDDSIIAWMREASSAGAANVVVSRGAGPTLALLDGQLMTAAAPSATPNDERGAGDSMTAAIAAALSAGGSLADALRHGVAAGTMNVTRSGMGTGRAKPISVIAEHVRINPLSASAGDDRGASITVHDAVQAIQRGVRAAERKARRR